MDTVLADVAVTRPYTDTARAVHHYLDRLDADGPGPDPTEGRRLVLAEHADGSITGRSDLDAVGGQRLQAALESLVQAGRGAGDARSRGLQRADALVQLCDNQLAAGQLPTLRGHKPQVIVIVGIEDLVDPGTGRGAARLGSGAPISAARARWLACDGQLTRVVLGPDGVPLDHGRAVRLFPPHVRRGGGARWRLRVPRLLGAHLVVRCAPPAGLDRRRRHRPGQPRYIPVHPLRIAWMGARKLAFCTKRAFVRPGLFRL